jgi:hypothetical protein
MSKKERLNLVVSPQTRAKIEVLQNRLDSGTLADVIKTSIQLLDIVSEHQRAGDKIILHRADGSESEITVVM